MKSQFFSRLKVFLKIMAIITGAFAVTVVVITLFYADEIKQLILTEMNKSLNTEIQVKKVDFSIWRHFPNATIDLENVVAKDAIESKDKDTLLSADHLSLLFNVKQIFSKSISVKKIILTNGAIHVRIDEQGRNNYHFWKSSEEKNDSSESSVIDLQKIILKNVLITYSDLHNHQRYRMTANDATVSGKFSKDEFVLKTDAGLFVDHFYVGNTDYVQNKKVKIKSLLTVNSKTNQYQFGETQVRIADLLFDVKGDVTSAKAETNLNLEINSHKAELQNLLSMLPPSYITSFKKYNSKGKFVFNSTIKGETGHGHSPDVKLTFSLADGLINPRGTNVSLEHLNLDGAFFDSSTKPGELTIRAFNGKFEGKDVSGDLKITDLQNPYLSLHAKADVDLNSVRAFVSHDTLESLNGNMKLNIAFAGRIKDMKKYASGTDYQSNSSGSIVIENVSFKMKRNPLEFKNINGRFALENNNIDVTALDGNISSTDFHLRGKFRNFISFLLIPGQDANIDASISSDFVELNELLATKETTSDTSYKLKLNPRLICSLNVSVKKLVFRRFEASDMNGSIHVRDEVISSPNLSFNSMSGNVAMSANIVTGRREGILIGCKGKINKIDITKMFYEMENFGQQTIVDKNVKGIIIADVVFNSSWSNDLVINSSKVVSQADFKIENGELNDFRPILPLSKYLKLADLKHIKFATLTNSINIHDRKIFFPNMEINSTALNLTASGVHDFDNNVDYKLKMLLSDVLSKKAKEQNTEFGTIEDDGLGRTKLFLAMKGPIDNPKFSLDKKSIKEKIKTDLVADRQTVKQALKQDLGLFKKDPTVTVQKKKKQEMQIDWGSEAQNK